MTQITLDKIQTQALPEGLRCTAFECVPDLTDYTDSLLVPVGTRLASGTFEKNGRKLEVMLRVTGNAAVLCGGKIYTKAERFPQKLKDEIQKDWEKKLAKGEVSDTGTKDEFLEDGSFIHARPEYAIFCKWYPKEKKNRRPYIERYQISRVDDKTPQDILELMGDIIDGKNGLQKEPKLFGLPFFIALISGIVAGAVSVYFLFPSM